MSAIWDFLVSIKLAVVEAFMFIVRLLGLETTFESLTSTNLRSKQNLEIETLLREYPNDKIKTLEWDTGDETEAAETILEDTTAITKPDERQHVRQKLAASMRQIRGYQKLRVEVEKRRLETFDPLDEDHEKKLLRLWELLRPDEELIGRKSEQWAEIGFQGDNPATDFRGMGMLGLDQLVFLAHFPFAICGITMTAITKDLLDRDFLKNHFYNVFPDSPSMEKFHQAYCRIFTLFVAFWVYSNPNTIMEFNLVKERFLNAIENYLAKNEANLCNAKLNEDFTFYSY